MAISPSKFLKALRESDFFIESIYMHGGCYQLYKILKTIFPSAKPYINSSMPHVATLVHGTLYDINGRIRPSEEKKFKPMTIEDMTEAEKWSFAGNNDLYYGECPNCGEPIKIDRQKLISMNTSL